MENRVINHNINPIVQSSNIITAIVKKLNDFFNQQSIYSGFEIWVEDSSLLPLLNNKTFDTDLKNELQNNKLYGFALKIDIKNEILSSATIAAMVATEKLLPTDNTKLYISLIKVQPTYAMKAKISAIANRGTLLESDYILDLTQQQQWNIGRGKTSASYYPFRDNDIVIDPQAKTDYQRKCNTHVSSFHAHILFDEENRTFYLEADEGGIDCGTVLQRGNNLIPLLTSDYSFPLMNGDLIRLGSSEYHVLLKFEI